MAFKLPKLSLIKTIVNYPNSLKERRASAKAVKRAIAEEKNRKNAEEIKKIKEDFESLGPTILLILIAQLGVMIPDIDQMFLSILHHRSIVTHSVFLPVLVYVLLRLTKINQGYLKTFFSGIFIGLGIHLGADVTTLLTSANHGTSGFGAICLPEPIKVSIGWFSPIWIIINSIASFTIATRMLNKPFSVFSAVLVAGLYYSYSNEGSILAAISIVLLGYVSVQMMNRKTNLLVKKSALTSLGAAFCIILTLSLPSALMSFSKLFNSETGTNSSRSIPTATSTPSNRSNGQWVKHSAGGWIQRDSNGYIKGTYRKSKPD